jgi:hypothetical protein
MVPPMSNPPLSIKSFGAVGDGIKDNFAIIQQAMDVAKAQGQGLYVPGGRYAYNGRFRLSNVDMFGDGPTSILHSLNTDLAAIFVTGVGTKVRKLLFSGKVPTVRTSPWETTRVVMKDGASDFEVSEITIETGSGAGIMCDQESHNGKIWGNYVHDTLADSIHIVGKSHHIEVYKNKIRNSGDDGIACVSYRNNGGMVNNVHAHHNDIRDNKWGRGMSVVGGSDILHEFNFISNNKQSAGMIYAQEDSYDTFACHNVTSRHNTVVNCGNADKGHWNILAVASNSDHNSGLLIERNVVIDELSLGGIDVRVNNDNSKVGQCVVVSIKPFRLATGVVFVPYSEGPVGIGD